MGQGSDGEGVLGSGYIMTVGDDLDEGKIEQDPWGNGDDRRRGLSRKS